MASITIPGPQGDLVVTGSRAFDESARFDVTLDGEVVLSGATWRVTYRELHKHLKHRAVEETMLEVLP